VQERGFSVILSDMCPVVSGITTKDEAVSCELGMRAISLAVGKIKVRESADYSETMEKFQSSTDPDPDEDGVLRRGGNLVIKFLENEDVPGCMKFLPVYFVFIVAAVDFTGMTNDGLLRCCRVYQIL
jgi:hypothetical protein